MQDNTGNILFEKFEIIECLKKDVHASVYLATHIYLGKKIILKTLNTNELSDNTILGRFKREAKILAQLDHSNLIKVLDFGTFENHFYISFEYFESRNLREVIKQNDLSDDDKFNIFVQLLKALNIAHQNNIVHRDIKPENILLNSEKHLKIADFGLALIETEDTLTKDSSIVGTPSYMSPEQLRGDKTLQTDIFSSGIVIYELYTGSNPFTGKTVSEVVNKTLSYDENSGSINYKKLPDNVRDAVISMLRKDQNDRAKSALEVLQMLGIEADIYEPVSDKKTPKENLKLYVSSAAVLVVVVLASYLYINLNSTTIGNNQVQNPFETNNLNTDSISTANYLIDSNSIKPLNIKNEVKANEKSIIKNTRIGKFFVECIPYAEVYIDGKNFGTTPLKGYIELKTGKHTLKLENSNFPSYITNINILPDKIESISINFNNIVGYLECVILPWGNIFIDGKLKGVSPLRLPLLKGKYELSFNHPNYESQKENISINVKDTLKYNFNFVKSGIAKKSDLKTE